MNDSPWNELLGQDQAVLSFQRAAERKRLAQAYLLVGPGGVGKRLFAQLVVRCLFCQRSGENELAACGECPSCVQLKAGTHADLIEVGLQPGKRQLLVEQFAGERDERGKAGLGHDLSLTPVAADRKCAIIDDADRMGEEAANAFLKTLEEPPPGAMIFLMARSTEGILPTILSRCQLVRFNPLSDEVVRDLLVQHEMCTDPAEATEVARLSHGSLEEAGVLLQPHLRDLRKTMLAHLGRLPIDGPTAAAAILEGVDAAGETAAQREAMNWVVRFGVEYFRQLLLACVEAEHSSAATEQQNWINAIEHCGQPAEVVIGDIIERLGETDRSIAMNVSVPLCVETLFQDLAGRSKSLLEAATIKA
ncbi:DNA polymerase III subunit tau [Calycomorphotria hydatis]|uniref:DNA polymerase III subunit tau n=2 Tax=Calycomorphotria hydatis TaxID=2528027 RepID=A0A517T831_9PLAN|nr:DNA polymerase III subunit tau [Calycomorphotria hydatis]